MTSLSNKFNAALVSGVQETTLTLANFNFDFSLYKVEPPTEYQGLGNILSKRRRQAAESGSEHVFARRLVALFAQSLPATPNLLRAYGSRATEVAKSPAVNPQGSRDDGVFQDWVGADATSIWAAATSGSSAIAVHLLACMLARLWSASEATAIWDEIIEARKQELSKMDPSDPLHLPTLAAGHAELTREQMASWDASARAWLSVADDAKKWEQTQLTLLVKDSGLPVNQMTNVYSSVMDAWKTAMTTVEKIIVGIPHTVQDGATLLGLTSWHIYPAMYVLGASPNEISFKDPLVSPHGIVTLGVSSNSPDSGNGVYWSLPLAYLRFYGDPVPSSKTIGDSSTRLSVSDFFQVILGAVFAGWERHGDDIQQASNLVVTLWDFIITSRISRSREASPWLQYLAEAAEAYVSSSNMERKYLDSLISRGRRRHGNFLAEQSNHPSPMFGISHVPAFMSLIDDAEMRVAALRFIAKTLNARPDLLIIRYRPNKEVDPLPSFNSETFISESFEDKKENSSLLKWEYATALKISHNPKKRKLEPDKDLSGHSRWVHQCSEPTRPPSTDQNGEVFQHLSEIEVVEHSSKSFTWNSNASYFKSTRSAALRSHLYECILGNPDEAAIFKRSDIIASGSEEIDADVLITALNARWIDSTKLVEHLDNLGGRRRLSGTPTYSRTLRALAAAANVYKLMPNASINTSIFSRPLQDAMWIPDGENVETDQTSGMREDESQTPEPAVTSQIMGSSIDPRLIFKAPQCQEDENRVNNSNLQITSGKLSTYTMTRAQTFACIAMFENGKVNLDPKSLRQVMALSASNSIYVAMSLICDPYDCPLAYEIKRIVGNIGRSGISLLIPPIKPKVRKIDEDQWNQINHARFDGNFDDAFQHTSMHLSFTRYKLPISVSSHGEQNVEAHFIETLVSIFDRQEWVADLDILGALQSPYLIRIEKMSSCRHKRRHDPPFRLTSIDSWDEYLDRPTDAALFRANKNWKARLSATVLNANLQKKTVLFRDAEAVCWACVANSYKASADISLSVHDQTGEVPIFIC